MYVICNSHHLASTLSWFKFWWKLVGVFATRAVISSISHQLPLRKLSCKLSLANTRATLVLVWPEHASWENSHANSRFSTLINSCSRLTGTWELKKLSCKLSLANTHATLVLVWPGHVSWENSHADSRLLTLINSHSRLTRTFPQSVYRRYSTFQAKTLRREVRTKVSIFLTEGLRSKSPSSLVCIFQVVVSLSIRSFRTLHVVCFVVSY